jgi:hypothetical protein
VRLARLLPPHLERRWDLARQMGVMAEVTNHGWELTGGLPGTGSGISVGYEATGTVHTLEWMRHFTRCEDLG